MKRTIIKELKNYFELLWPLNRSLTGDDVRKTHRILSQIIPLKTYEIKSGTKVMIAHLGVECKNATLKDASGKYLLIPK